MLANEIFAGRLSPSDLLRKQPRWERIAEYTQRWADSLAQQTPTTPSEQVHPDTASLQGRATAGPWAFTPSQGGRFSVQRHISY